MSQFIICGKPNCTNFVHAIYVAEYLRIHLPNFLYKKVEKADAEFTELILELNKNNKWYFTRGPIIWKEISKWGGKKYLIGGLSEFWEYCYCYYGFESIIPKTELIKLAKDNMKFFTDEQNRKKNVKHTSVAILGATNFMTSFLVKELTMIEDLVKPNGLKISIFDEKYKEDGNVKRTMDNIVEAFNSTFIFGNAPFVFLAEQISEALAGCDLVIHLEDFTRKPEEDDILTWFQRCLDSMGVLADYLQAVGKRTTRVVLCNEGPVCFLATCLIEFCTNLKPTNIVALTADQGYSVINLLREMSQVPCYRISAPPVWGFVGYKSFADEANTIFKAQVYRPYRRALTAPPGSTLPLGTVKSDLRKMSYIVHSQEEFQKALQTKKEIIISKLGRHPVQGKLRALKSLLIFWYNEKNFDEIISLGVCSDGSFDIPPGIVFSQPVMQDPKHRWRPFKDFPLMDENTQKKISECIDAAIFVMESLQVQTEEAEDPEDYLYLNDNERSEENVINENQD